MAVAFSIVLLWLVIGLASALLQRINDPHRSRIVPAMMIAVAIAAGFMTVYALAQAPHH